MQNYNISELCVNYLGVDRKSLSSFLLKKRRVLDKMIAKYGFPLSETNKDSVEPLDYSNGGVEFMLDEDFGKYGGTQDNVEVVEEVNNIIVYRFV